jgi:hypothetical protein
MAYLLENGRVVLASPISSGRNGHLTENGSFKVLEKERTHYSSMYGKIVDSRGNTIVADADADMPIPPGEDLFLCQCITPCGSPGPTECMPDIYRLSGFARLCPDAGTIRDCVLQFSQCWHTGHGVRKEANRALPGAITTDISKQPL